MSFGHDRTLEPAVAEEVSAPWWRNAVVYESHLPSLRDGNGDGVGDLEGLIASLDYLSETLGVDAVWIGPFFRSPLLDQGYDVSDHTDVEPLFGDLEAADRLIEEAHARGMKVIVDYIPNHTSDRHRWFVESRSSRESRRRAWYVWADPAPDGGPPNNWLAESGGSSWEFDEATGQYYLHSHLKEQPDLNWRNPEVRHSMHDVLRFWLDRGVDGLRIDVVHMLMKDPELRDNPPNPGGAPNEYDIQHPEFTTQLHVNDRMHPDLHQVLREMRAVFSEYEGDRVGIGEVEAVEWSRWASYFGDELDELQLPFAFQLIETPWNATDLAATLAALDAAVPDGGWPMLALGNHDRPRVATRLGRAQARVAAMLLLTARGTPSLFYGDELGMVDQEVPRERQRDAFGLTEDGVSRDSTRTPMPWSATLPNAGFSDAEERELWLPVSRERETINVETQLADPRSMLALYRRLISLRRSSPALSAGAYVAHHSSDAHCLVYERRAAGDRKLVALNTSSQPRTVAVGVDGTIALSTGLDREDEPLGAELALRADEGIVADLEPGPAEA